MTSSGEKQYQPNTGLNQLEEAFCRLLNFSLPQKAEKCEGYLDQMRRALETHGYENGWIVASSANSRERLSVLALDLAWLRPGPMGYWSEKGVQAYSWRKPHSSKQRPPSWYQRVLTNFFSDTNATSLLSLPRIYGRERWIHWTWINADRQNTKAGAGYVKPGTQKDFDCAMSVFRPRADLRQTPTGWEERFKKYKECLATELEQEFGKRASRKSLLLCVYVSSGNQHDPSLPPNWGVCLFAVFSARPQRERNWERFLGAVISNIYNSLKAAAQKALEARPEEKRNLAQAISHEFKNLNQEVATLADAAKREFNGLPQDEKARLAKLKAHLDALQISARATTSICLGTYWLFSPRDAETVAVPDKNCYLFRYIMALAIRILAPSRPHWKLVGIPVEGRITSVLARQLGVGASSNTLADLLRLDTVSAMLFLALEPIRNIKDDSVELRLKATGNKITLTQTAFADQPPHLRWVPSLSVQNMMKALEDLCPWKLVRINPRTAIRAFKSKGGRYRVVRSTTITVYNIISKNPRTKLDMKGRT